MRVRPVRMIAAVLVRAAMLVPAMTACPFDNRHRRRDRHRDLWGGNLGHRFCGRADFCSRSTARRSGRGRRRRMCGRLLSPGRGRGLGGQIGRGSARWT
ncbi:hypothetical protein NLX62_01400, partial [Mycobacteriaceae bacterium Msp059]|nr:hypothetical protein [Mycobacteriaceae bacterium Msp059]